MSDLLMIGLIIILLLSMIGLTKWASNVISKNEEE